MLTSIKNMHRKVVVRSMTEHMIALRLFSSVAPAIPESQRSLISPLRQATAFPHFAVWETEAQKEISLSKLVARHR